MLQRQGQLGADGSPAAPPRRPTGPGAPGGPSRRPPSENRASIFTRIAQYLREVRVELSKVLWPKRPEVVNYSTVVITTLVLLALLIFGLNFVFAKGVLQLFKS
ncbi:MAG TPA: preprotein translocase subunit SecE [Acidimicrobiales bacterium]|nr:preprotein translocase subunit SecE [Acidimicrobiales bacterium]